MLGAGYQTSPVARDRKMGLNPAHLRGEEIDRLVKKLTKLID